MNYTVLTSAAASPTWRENIHRHQRRLETTPISTDGALCDSPRKKNIREPFTELSPTKTPQRRLNHDEYSFLTRDHKSLHIYIPRFLILPAQDSHFLRLRFTKNKERTPIGSEEDHLGRRQFSKMLLVYISQSSPGKP
jgi:hypothetical protein